jgi:hypothetical protein
MLRATCRDLWCAPNYVAGSARGGLLGENAMVQAT